MIKLDRYQVIVRTEAGKEYDFGFPTLKSAMWFKKIKLDRNDIVGIKKLKKPVKHDYQAFG